MTQEEYWRDFDLIRRDVTVAAHSFATYLEIHAYARESPSIYVKINQEAPFSTLQLYGLQAMSFIALGRVFDKDRDAHSIRKFIDATTTYKGFFSKSALEARKIPPGQARPEWLDEFMRDTHEPSVEELEAMSDALKPHEERYKSVYAPIRHEVFAHTVIKDEGKLSDLFSKTLIGDVEDTLHFLGDLLETVWHLGYNGVKPVLGMRPRDFNGARSRYKEAVRRVLSSLS